MVTCRDIVNLNMDGVEQIAANLACGRDKAIKVSAELDSKKGIGLIEKVKRGLGKPDIIYVKNFVIQDRLTDRRSISSEVDYSDFKELGNHTSVNREKGITCDRKNP